jgi:hypothetical protein
MDATDCIISETQIDQQSSGPTRTCEFIIFFFLFLLHLMTKLLGGEAMLVA